MTSFLGPKWDVTKELTDIKVASEGRQKYRVTCKDFGDITVLKPFLIALTLMFFFQCTGINIILQFTVDIFQSADSTVQVFQVCMCVYFQICLMVEIKFTTSPRIMQSSSRLYYLIITVVFVY